MCVCAAVCVCGGGLIFSCFTLRRLISRSARAPAAVLVGSFVVVSCLAGKSSCDVKVALCRVWVEVWSWSGVGWVS